ncbi:MAG: GAF domain-containing protein [Candidatus Omnitrophica bacterium]|nr:GAF domain-containing protein [Candidatus Omnitrophota bacterium]
MFSSDQLSLVFYAAACWLTGLVDLVLGFSVGITGQWRRLHRNFFYICVTVCVWSFALSMQVVSDSERRAWILSLILHSAVLLIPYVYFRFINILLGCWYRQLLWLGWLIIGVLGWGLYSGYVVGGVHSPLYFRYYSSPGPWYPLMLAYFLGYSVFGFVLVLKARASASPQQRNQLNFVLAASMVGFYGGSMTYLPVYGIPPILPTVIVVPLYPVLLAYAIVRHRMLDLSIALTRTGAWAVVYFFVLVIPVTFSIALKETLEQLVPEYWWLFPVGLYTLLAACAPLAAGVASRRVERLIRREERHYQDTLLAAASGMTRIRNLDHLFSLIVRVLTKTVGLTHAAIFQLDKDSTDYVQRKRRGSIESEDIVSVLADDPLVHALETTRDPLLYEDLGRSFIEQHVDDPTIRRLLAGAAARMQSLKAALIVPCFVERRLLGFIVLGNKKNRAIFSKEDLNVFRALASQAGLAVENALFFQEIESTHAQLFQSEKLATVGQLASGMAHEIRNPLAIISVKAQALRMQNELPPLGELMTVMTDIEGQCQRASDIIRRLLQFSKVQKGNDIIDINHAVEETIAMVNHQISLDNIEIGLKLSDETPRVVGNLNELQEVFLNLMINAAQAMGNKGGKIALSTDVDKEMVEIKVADTGPGISEENLRHLFDPFFTTKDEGTGLGLYVVHRVVEKHVGHIWAASEVGKGTTFVVRLPLATEKDIQEQEEKTA